MFAIKMIGRFRLMFINIKELIKSVHWAGAELPTVSEFVTICFTYCCEWSRYSFSFEVDLQKSLNIKHKCFTYLYLDYIEHTFLKNEFFVEKLNGILTCDLNWLSLKAHFISICREVFPIKFKKQLQLKSR